MIGQKNIMMILKGEEKMKKNERIQCPFCKKYVKDVIKVDVRVTVLYYLRRQKFGNVYGPYSFILKHRKNKRLHKILSLDCRSCGKVYPLAIQKKLWKYLEYRKILDGLKDSN